MIAWVRKYQPKEPPKNGRLLTKREAFELLDANHNYMKSIESHIGERHLAEIIADAMARDGLVGLAGYVNQLHDAMKCFAKGDFKQGQFLAEIPVIASLIEDAKQTKFAASAEALASELDAFRRIVGQEIDWKKSSKVLAKAKREHFPEDLTMVEKLDHWQGEQAKRTH